MNNCTDQIPFDQRIAILKELILWLESNHWHAAAIRIKNQLERLKQSQRCSQRA